MTELMLRGYQSACVMAIEDAWAGRRRPDGDDVLQRPLATLATGLGKTLIFADLVRRRHDADPRRRSLVLVEREELADQAAKKLRMAAPRASVGLVKAEHNDVSSDIVVGSVPTLRRLERRVQLTNVGTVICDEAHHVSADGWQAILTDLGCFDPTSGVLAAGFTATPVRNDSRKLGDTWQREVFSRDLLWGIKHGWLVDLRAYRVQVHNLELEAVKRARGDLNLGDLGDCLVDADAGNAIAEAYVKHGRRRRGVVFAPTVASANHFAEELNAAGIRTAVVSGMTPTVERQQIYRALEHKEIQAIANCATLIEGWDAPWVSLVVLRPTSSPILYSQMVGRGTRPFPGKKDCLVLDVGGASENLSLMSVAKLTRTKIDEVGDGETLTEALVRNATDADPIPEPKRVAEGLVKATEVDLFSGSRSMWLQTPAGTWFIPTANAFFYLWPRPDGTYNLGRLPTKGRRWSDTKLLERELDLDYGMSWAERYAAEEDPSIANKRSPWRRRKEPSEAQKKFLTQLGKVHGRDYSTRSEASNLISVHYATRSIDYGSRPKVSK